MSVSEPSHFITAEGISFYIEQVPGEPATIFLHGFAGDMASWSLVWDQLPENFPRIRYDLRGFGLSKITVPEPFSHTSDLLSLVNSLNLSRFNVVGLSMGGAIALNFALGYPQRLNKLVLLSPGLVGWQWSEPWVEKWRSITAAARSGNMATAKQSWWQHPLFDTTRRTADANLLYDSIARYSGEEWLKDYQQEALPDIDRLITLQVETLLLTGERDLDDFRLIASLIENAAQRVTRVDHQGLGHLINIESPAVVAEHILDFLTD
ncbi:alpha/beta fold hydrolase [Halioxenophilus aromaticivorans]|uniref:Alpha/beta hydrolase n=1 Tax=Halioxenophilus aromaticivorans TaxID=1306992 RepID=A0AAV3U3C3_9ALTE